MESMVIRREHIKIGLLNINELSVQLLHDVKSVGDILQFSLMYTLIFICYS